MKTKNPHFSAYCLFFFLMAIIGFASAPPLPRVKALADQFPCTVDFFKVNGKAAFLIRPKDKAVTEGNRPWVWYAPVIGHPNPTHAWMLRQWLAEGIAMAGVDVGESFGNPQGRHIYTGLWEKLVMEYGMSKRPCLLPQSRGGLMLYNWAVEQPDKVACIAGIYTVCDLQSYPGLARACGAYGLSESELARRLKDHNPIERLKPLAVAGVPIFHIHGDSDTVVPLEANAGGLVERYRALGGSAQLVVVPGKGHQVCPEFFESQALVDFVSTHAGRTIDHASPVRICLNNLIQHGQDRYGKVHTPLLVSILDTKTLKSPENPAPLDEAYRVTRRDRRNPAAADPECDQALLKTMLFLSAISGDPQYAEAARRYCRYTMENLVDKKGFFWWGWHRRYDVFEDAFKGHSGDHHEIHAIHEIAWETLWSVNPDAVTRQIEAIWQWHVIDKQTGEINRHGDGRRGCDFSMSAGSFIEAFAFLFKKTGRPAWLERAKLLAAYYWERRDPKTNLVADRPNAGKDRFDGGCFVTATTGLYCHSLMKAWQLTGDTAFRDQAMTYLKAYARYGFDPDTGKYWGALRLDGTPIPGPRLSSGYAMYEPRGHLDLWEPYVAGYQFAIYTAQAYASAYLLTGDETMGESAKRFAAWICRTPPGTDEGNPQSWYRAYSDGPGKQGTYAGKYGRTISFFLTLYAASGKDEYLDSAIKMAGEAKDKLWSNGLFRGHPAKPYYENIDGVGYLLYALLQLDAVFRDPKSVAQNKAITLHKNGRTISLPLENW